MSILSTLRSLYRTLVDEPWLDSGTNIVLNIQLGSQVPYPQSILILRIGKDRHSWIVNDTEYEDHTTLLESIITDLRKEYIKVEED